MSELKSYDEMNAEQQLAYKMGREAERARWDDPDEVRAAVVPLLDYEAAAKAACLYSWGADKWDEDVKAMWREMAHAVVDAALGLGEDTEGGEK